MVGCPGGLQAPQRRLNLLEAVVATIQGASPGVGAAAAERATSLLNSLHAMLAAAAPDATPQGAVPVA